MDNAEYYRQTTRITQYKRLIDDVTKAHRDLFCVNDPVSKAAYEAFHGKPMPSEEELQNRIKALNAEIAAL